MRLAGLSGQQMIMLALLTWEKTDKAKQQQEKIVMEPQQFKSESWKQTKCQNKIDGALPSLKSEEKGENSDGTLADPGKVRGVKKTESEEKTMEHQQQWKE